MIIEFHGAGFVNKGSELMLRTAMSELSCRIANLESAVFPRDDCADERARLNLRHMLPSRGRGGLLLGALAKADQVAALVGREKYRKLLRLYGLVDVGMADAMVDISGFAISDAWGPAPAERLLHVARTYKRRDAPVVLLPQALGPITSSRLRRTFAGIAQVADLVYARDAESFRMAEEAAPGFEGLRVAPDITLFDGFDGHDPDPQGEPYCCLIPNARVIDRPASESGVLSYEECLGAMVGAILDSGYRVKLTLHTTEAADAELAARLVADREPPEVEVVRSGDPYELKRLFANSRLVVGSRYHGLVSALGQGTPGSLWAGHTSTAHSLPTSE